jgi:signal transduction histidine kinase
MSKIARRTLVKRMVLTQLAGMAVFLFFAAGALLAVLPHYLRLPEEIATRLAGTPAVAWSVGIVLFLAGLLAWIFVAVLIARRMNGSIEWILHRIGIRFGAEWTVSEAITPRVMPELEGWREDIDAKMSDLLIRSALVSGQVFLHEFGNHMNAIYLRTSKVRRQWQGPPEGMLPLTDAIEDTVEFLSDLSKLVDGTVSDLKQVNVLDVIREAPRKLFIDRTRVKTPDVESEPTVSPLVNAMKGMLMQVMLNLIRNALEWSQDDVIISVRVDGGQVVIRVEDSAPMDERIVEELFIIPPAPPGPRTQKHFGLGLPLCRAYMQAMGGSIEYRPANGNGRKAFEIYLPLSPAQSESSSTKE